MGWLIFLAVFGIPLILKMRRNYKQNQVTNRIINALRQHSPEEMSEIAQWELKLRTELAKHQLLLDSGQISDNEFIDISQVLLKKHREIERKYNVTEEEMDEYYRLAYRLETSSK